MIKIHDRIVFLFMFMGCIPWGLVGIVFSPMFGILGLCFQFIGGCGVCYYAKSIGLIWRKDEKRG